MIATRRGVVGGLILACLLAGAVGLALGRGTQPLPHAAHFAASTFPTPATGDTSDPQSSPSQPEHPTPASDYTSASAGAVDRWKPAAEGFGMNYTNLHGGQRAWLGRLSTWSTEQVSVDLATVDLTNIPAGRYGEYELIEPGESQIAVRVTYREGWSLVLYLVSDGTRWQVSGYDLFEE